MITDKICFAHIRQLGQNGQYLQNGGATVAWYINEEGVLVVGQPARCHETDAYVKSVGRDKAMKKLTTEPHLTYVTREQLVTLGLSSPVDSFDALVPNNGFLNLTPNLNYILQECARQIIAHDLFNAVRSDWFEGVVRSFFILRESNWLSVDAGRIYQITGKFPLQA